MIPEITNRPWKVLESKTILNLGVWLNVRQETVQLPSGKEIPTWFVLDFPDWINVIAITKDGQFVMEDQYRHGLGVTNLEICAGVVDEGETPLEAAKRELSEETGFGGGNWSLYMKLSPNPTNHNNISWTYLATDVEPIGKPHQEATEDIHVHLLTREELETVLRRGDIIQALHAAPLWKYLAESKSSLTMSE